MTVKRSTTSYNLNAAEEIWIKWIVMRIGETTQSIYQAPEERSTWTAIDCHSQRRAIRHLEKLKRIAERAATFPGGSRGSIRWVSIRIPCTVAVRVGHTVFESLTAIPKSSAKCKNCCNCHRHWVIGSTDENEVIQNMGHKGETIKSF